MEDPREHDPAAIFSRERFGTGSSFILSVCAVVREAGISIEEAKRVACRVEFGMELEDHQALLLDDLEALVVMYEKANPDSTL